MKTQQSFLIIFLLGIAVLFSACDDGDDTNVECTAANTIDLVDNGCDTPPTKPNEYAESKSGDVRTITANTYPNHEFTVTNPNVTELQEYDRTYTVDATPSLASSNTSILSNENRPRYYTGISLNGIPLDPSPAEPFIFENANTGEYNWDWVMEPVNNRTEVGLDCNTAHAGPFGYHYHGDMVGYADSIMSGLGSGTTIPTEVVQIGWAADGFPVVYKYGPDASGTFKALTPSYKLKSGERPGDGVSEPCGTYSGIYTVDYEYSSGLGDLDECNGIAQSITLRGQTFNYFYVITDDFPVIGRCLSGTPDASFVK